jgi:hypothetical protein
MPVYGFDGFVRIDSNGRFSTEKDDEGKNGEGRWVLPQSMTPPDGHGSVSGDTGERVRGGK